MGETQQATSSLVKKRLSTNSTHCHSRDNLDKCMYCQSVVLVEEYVSYFVALLSECKLNSVPKGLLMCFSVLIRAEFHLRSTCNGLSTSLKF